MKNIIVNKLVAGILIIVAIGVWSNVIYSAVSSESLIYVQDPNASTTVISGRKVKDAGNIANGQTTGLIATGLMGFNGTGWDRVQTTTGSLNVNISGSSGTSTIAGAQTPSDTYTNPTNAIGSWSLLGLWDNVASQWRRATGDGTYGLDVDVTRVSGNVTVVQPISANLNATVAGSVATYGGVTPADTYGNPTTAQQTYALLGLYNGANWNMARGDTTNGMYVNVTKTPMYSTMSTNQVTVDTTAGGTLVKALNTSRKEIMLQNLSASSIDVYCGNTGVTTSTGFRIQAGASYIDDKFTGAFYCITGSSTAAVSYREVQ